MLWSIKNSVEVLGKLKSRGFRATSLSAYDFSTFYTTLPHNLIKKNLPSKRSTKIKVYFGLVRMYVTPYRIFWIIYTSDLVISYMVVVIYTAAGTHT